MESMFGLRAVRLAHFAMVMAALSMTLPLKATGFIEYAYTGNYFNFFTANPGPYSASDFVSGYFTVAAPLADNMTLTGGTDITALSFSFTDGVQTYTQATADLNASSLQIATDANGNIIQWIIGVGPSNGGAFVATNNVVSGNTCDCDAGNQPPFEAEIVNDPGTWIADAPEPAGFMLCGIGLLAARAIRRRSR